MILNLQVLHSNFKELPIRDNNAFVSRKGYEFNEGTLGKRMLTQIFVN